MALITRLPSLIRMLVVASVVPCLEACGGDGGCDVGRSFACTTSAGDEGAQICSDGAELSECFRLETCNPLIQEGCPAGTYCFTAEGTNADGGGTFCAQADVYPCSPNETAKVSTERGLVCMHFCSRDQCSGVGPCTDPENCNDGEFCILSAVPLPDGVGECAIEGDE
jgi:hypothetical protein